MLDHLPVNLILQMRSLWKHNENNWPGPVVVDIPKDVQNWKGPFKGTGTLPLHGYQRRLAKVEANVLSDEACERFFTMLSESGRPLIYAGGGVINANATKAMRHIASAYGIPVTTGLLSIIGSTSAVRSFLPKDSSGAEGATWVSMAGELMSSASADLVRKVVVVPFEGRTDLFAHAS